ncbi:MAG: TadE/TadG family type IV pilus assembly protein [Candidatus Paracaedibacter sp.]
MIRIITSKFQALRRGEKGAVMVFVGLCLLPLFLVMGLAIDSSVGLEQKRKLQAAVDIAAKAGIANGNGVAATITSEAQKMFAANVANMTNITGPNISVNTAANTISLSASIAVSNTFMGLAGLASTNYTASTTLPMSNKNLAEVAIVYEVSNRFGGNNYHKNICDALITRVLD